MGGAATLLVGSLFARSGSASPACMSTGTDMERLRAGDGAGPGTVAAPALVSAAEGDAAAEPAPLGVPR